MPGEESVLDALQDVDDNVVVVVVIEKGLIKGGKVGEVAALVGDGRGTEVGAWLVVQGAFQHGEGIVVGRRRRGP